MSSLPTRVAAGAVSRRCDGVTQSDPKQPASIPRWDRRRAACSPRSRCRGPHWASTALALASIPSAGKSTDRRRQDSLCGSGTRRAMVTNSTSGHTEPTLRDLSEASSPHAATDYGVTVPLGYPGHDMTRQAAATATDRYCGRRRCPRACPGRRTGPQHRRAGCGESRLEAGPGGKGRSPKISWIPTTPNATRSVLACCATRCLSPLPPAGDERTNALRDTM